MADTISNIVDSIFNIKKNKLYLIGIFVLAFTLRLIAAINISVTADDMHHVLHAINFLGANRLITYDQSSGLWHLFTSLMYNIFGIGQLSSRAAALIFGSFSVFAIYLLSREFFDEKISLIAAFLLAIAPFHIKNTYAEMDVMAMFFVILSMFFFVKSTKQNKTKYFIFAGLFMGLGLYTKVYPVLFIPSLIIYFIISKKISKEKVITKDHLKKIALFILFAFVFAVPAITHNYLLYKDKGFMDLQFSRTFGLGEEKASEYYSWDPIWGRKNSWSGLIFGDTAHIASGVPLLIGVFNFIRMGDPVTFYLALLGLFFIFPSRREKFNYFYFFVLSILFATCFLGSIILLPKHFVFLELLMIPLAAFSVNKIDLIIARKFGKISIKSIVVVLLVLSLILLSLSSTGLSHFYAKSGVAQVMEFKDKNIPSNSLIVFDGRIYTGTGYWMSYNRPFIDGPSFLNLASQQDKMEGNFLNVDAYYIECAIDDCGWGADKVAGSLNDSMEALTKFFEQKGAILKQIEEPLGNRPYNPLSNDQKRNVYNIYTAKIQIKEPIMAVASQPKKWFLYDIGYEPKANQFDYYKTDSFSKQSLNYMAKMITRIALIISILSLLVVFYITVRR